MSDQQDRNKHQQDPLQRQIDERLEQARYKVPQPKKVRNRYENLQTLLATIMALGIVIGLVVIVIQLFVK
ncbi:MULTISPECIES: hypothetical protein [Leuconostoc]|uniref:Accessory secretory protein Asp4 n=1 Tax=Leuconostoc kimchii TaxID=136609 RepID=A0ABX5SNF2_9LACO|nr:MULTISPECIES: hypothetical protein [Leuconostoc]AEJ30906.1 accessory secretory protein asp4 [Leuconostoc sp. C2]QBR48008.1 accessory secretory protein Asp4 [Leuconostoc kimchii]